jgi:hypothetical protein
MGSPFGLLKSRSAGAFPAISEDPDGQRAVIHEAQQHLAGAARALEMKRRQHT